MEVVDFLYAHRDALISLKGPLIVIPIYVALCYGGKWLMRNRKPFDVSKGLAVHNFLLFVMSVGMFTFAGIETYKVHLREGSWYPVYCGSSDVYHKSKTFWLALWLFYASKYYELLDTLFIILKKAPLLKLHVFHHCIILPFCLVYIYNDIVYYGVGVMWNCGIHTAMYWYYYRAAMGVRPKWGKYLTTMQITQFMYGVFTFIPRPFVCDKPEWFVLLANQAILLLFAYLFYNFYAWKYKKGAASKRVSSSSASDESSATTTNNKDKEQ